MEATEHARLKEFMEANFCFDTMKQMGFWDKGTRRTDYEKQAARVCHYFGFETVYEYGRELRDIQQVSDTVTVGGIASTVAPDGQLQPAGGFLLHTAPPTRFACPVCTCEQDAESHAAFRRSREYAKVRCKGCKRPLVVGLPPWGDKPLWVEERPG